MKPFQRGFYCSDLSLRYPYQPPTLSIPMLVMTMLVSPLFLLAIVEMLRLRCGGVQWRIRTYFSRVWRIQSTFSSGFLATFFTSELIKNMVGRLRPHFYDACQPRFRDGSSCDDPKHFNSPVYVQDYYCSNMDLTAGELREIHISFPSAHTCLSFFTISFMCVYLHKVWSPRGCWRAVLHATQFVLVLIGCYFASSRIADYWHHWSDVLGGVILGLIFSLISTLYVGRYLLAEQVGIDQEKATKFPRSCCERKNCDGGQQQQQQQQLQAQPECEWKLSSS